MTERLVDTGSALLNVFDEGTGPAVVLLHGWSYDLHLWDGLVPELHARGLRTVRYDQRGHGASPTTSGYRFDTLVADLGALIGVLDLRRPALCGLSLGGFVAMQFAADRPDDVSAVVLADTCPHAIPQDREMAATIPSTADGAAALGEWWDMRHPVIAERDGGVHAARRERFLRNDADGLAHAIAACAARTAVTDRLPRITAPTRVICGENDAFFPPSVHADLADRIHGADLVVLPGAGHISCTDDPRAFAGAAVPFLAGVLNPAPARGSDHSPAAVDAP